MLKINTLWKVAPLGVCLGFAIGNLAACGGGSGGGTPPQQGAFANCDATLDPDPNNVDQNSATFNVVGTQAFMNGDIDGTMPAKVQALIQNNPNVTEIVLQNCPGSGDDDSNLTAARMVRAAGLNTRTEAQSVIASGAVDFFLAGTARVAHPMSQILVHSWADGNNMLGRDFPRDSCEHAKYVFFYRDMGMMDPSGFYFYTLQSGLPTVNITAAERLQYGISTP